jgi:hypothetical protein
LKVAAITNRSQKEVNNMSWTKLIMRLGVLLLGVFLLIQLAPIPTENPPVSQEVAWNTAETERLARVACYDCHSNETVWPWYSNVAPVSWRVAMHVIEGRRHLNFSTWDKPQSELAEVLESITEGEMPLSDYVMLHPEASLTTAEQEALLDGLRITFTQDPPLAGENNRARDD